MMTKLDEKMQTSNIDLSNYKISLLESTGNNHSQVETCLGYTAPAFSPNDLLHLRDSRLGIVLTNLNSLLNFSLSNL